MFYHLRQFAQFRQTQGGVAIVLTFTRWRG